MNRLAIGVGGIGALALVGVGVWYWHAQKNADVNTTDAVSGGDGDAPEPASDPTDDGSGSDVNQSSGSSAPRPVRDNNWGDLIYTPSNQWRGQTGKEGGYAVFDTAHDGLRAAFINLHSYMVKHGLLTVDDIITQWAPPASNPTGAYITFVASALGLPADTPLSWRDINTVPMMMAICQFECGYQPGQLSDYTSALDDTGL